MPHIKTSDGVRLYYEETGSGLPLIFLHEFGGHYLSWEPQVRYFSRRYRCITYAARGWPPSDVPADVARYSPGPSRRRLRRPDEGAGHRQGASLRAVDGRHGGH
jgi:pimeloyl-ACP methyl ester carboxylesterase